MKHFILSFVAASLLLACETFQKSKTLDAPKVSLEVARFGLLAKIEETPLENRLVYGRGEQLAYIREFNRTLNSQTTEAAEDTEFTKAYQEAVNTLPESLFKLLSRHVRAVMVVKGSKPTATTAPDDNGRGVIFLDIDQIKVTPNEFVNRKEQKVFEADNGKFPVTIKVANSKDDHLATTIQMRLIHEVGHVLSWDPAVGTPFGYNLIEPHSAFFEESWGRDGKTLFRKNLPPAAIMNRVNFYFGEAAPLPRKDLAGLYKELALTNFVNLYSAQNPMEDYAESFALYVHTTLLKRPYEIRIQTGGKVQVIKACWEDQRCEGKKKILQSELKRIGLT